LLARLVSRRWLLATVLVLLASATMARLGIWQLDRLEQRRIFNARVLEQQSEPTLQLDAETAKLDLYSMEYRQVIVTGTYLHEDEIVLRNQVWEGEFGSELGVKLFTPLLVEGSDTAILVERGWIPEEQAEDRSAFYEIGLVTITGQLRRDETDFGIGLRLQPDADLAPGESRRDAWNNLDLERVAAQMNTPLLPVYVQHFVQGEQSQPPYASHPVLDLTEGPHQGYAFQWFSFAALLLIGYPVYVNRQEATKA
jgi:surfeit locus 1 family protein